MHSHTNKSALKQPLRMEVKGQMADKDTWKSIKSNYTHTNTDI